MGTHKQYLAHGKKIQQMSDEQKTAREQPKNVTVCHILYSKGNN